MFLVILFFFYFSCEIKLELNNLKTKYNELIRYNVTNVYSMYFVKFETIFIKCLKHSKKNAIEDFKTDDDIEKSMTKKNAKQEENNIIFLFFLIFPLLRANSIVPRDVLRISFRQKL